MRKEATSAPSITPPKSAAILLIWAYLVVSIGGFSQDPADGSSFPPGANPVAHTGLFIHAAPRMELAFGNRVDFVSLTAGVTVDLGYRFPRLPYLHLGVNTLLNYLPLASGLNALVFAFGGYAGGVLSLGQTFLFEASGGVGPFIGDFLQRADLQSKIGVYITVGMRLSTLLNPYLDVCLGLSYSEYFTFFRSVGLQVGIGYLPSGGIPRSQKQSTPGPVGGIRPRQITTHAEFDPIYPVLIKTYGENPCGTVSVMNRSRAILENVAIRVFIEDLIDDPVSVISGASVEPGTSVTAPVLAGFSERLLEILDDTEFSVRIDTEYWIRGEQATYSQTSTLRIYGRGTFAWDDIRTVAAFIAPDNPWIRSFSEAVTSVTEGEANALLDENLLKAIAFQEAISLSGIRYAADAEDAVAKISPRSRAIGRIRLPAETLSDLQGDRGDLAILFCALLEAAGVETSVIHSSGRLFMALAIRVSAGEAIATSRNPDMLIYREGKAWVPLDPASIGSGFISAWHSGIDLWRECKGKDDCAFTSTHDAWLAFKPAEIGQDSGKISVPALTELRCAYQEQVRLVLEYGF